MNFQFCQGLSDSESAANYCTEQGKIERYNKLRDFDLNLLCSFISW
jgi:hypothetical protein